MWLKKLFLVRGKWDKGFSYIGRKERKRLEGMGKTALPAQCFRLWAWILLGSCGQRGWQEEREGPWKYSLLSLWQRVPWTWCQCDGLLLNLWTEQERDSTLALWTSTNLQVWKDGTWMWMSLQAGKAGKRWHGPCRWLQASINEQNLEHEKIFHKLPKLCSAVSWTSWVGFWSGFISMWAIEWWNRIIIVNNHLASFELLCWWLPGNPGHITIFVFTFIIVSNIYYITVYKYIPNCSIFLHFQVHFMHIMSLKCLLTTLWSIQSNIIYSFLRSKIILSKQLGDFPKMTDYKW